MEEIHKSNRGLGGYQLREYQSVPGGRREAQSGVLSAAIFGKKIQSRASNKNPDHWQREDTPVSEPEVEPSPMPAKPSPTIEGYSPERGLGVLVRRAEETQPDGTVYIKVTVIKDGQRVTRDEMPSMDPEVTG